MTITENQRRALDLMAESAGWNWSDVEALSQDMFGDCVAGLTEPQADELQVLMATEGIERTYLEVDDAGA